MTAITAFAEVSEIDYPTSDTSIGTATPGRRKDIYLEFFSQGASDTIDLSATVDDNISSVEGIKSVDMLGEPMAGTTAAAYSGTSLTLKSANAGKMKVWISVKMK